VQATSLGDRESVRSLARQAEDLGYEELYSYDHLGAEDPFIPLVVAAEATSKLRVGPLVLNNEFHHPALLARTVATLDQMTGGRVVLGIGTGYAQGEHDAMGIELRRRGPRVDRLEESVVALRSLLDEGSVDLQAEHHRLAIEDLGVRPMQARVPLLIGGNGRQLVGVAGRRADIFQFTGLTHSDDGTPQPGGFALEAVVKRARWLGVDARERDEAIERSLLVQGIAIGGEAESAIDHATGRLGVERSVIESTPFLLFGSVPEVVDRLEMLRELLGVSHVVIRDPSGFAPVVSALAGR
jgi:probable F420-dependent oxidoreductase